MSLMSGIGIGAGALGGLATSAFGRFNQEDSQRHAIKLAKNRHRYEAGDLKRAGLNRRLTLGGSPPGPSGASAPGAPINIDAGKGYQMQTAKSLAASAKSEAEINAARALRKQEIVDKEVAITSAPAVAEKYLKKLPEVYKNLGTNKQNIPANSAKETAKKAGKNYKKYDI